MKKFILAATLLLAAACLWAEKPFIKVTLEDGSKALLNASDIACVKDLRNGKCEVTLNVLNDEKHRDYATFHLQPVKLVVVGSIDSIHKKVYGLEVHGW